MQRFTPAIVPAVLLCALAASLCSPTSTRAAAPSTADAVAKLAALNAWLGAGPNGDAWRNYAGLDVLENELTTGLWPRRDLLQGVLERLSAAHQGLDRPAFAQLRTALSALVAELPQTKADDVAALIEAAKQVPFKPISDAKVEAARRAAQRSLDKLTEYLRGIEVGPGWMEYLETGALAEMLSSNTAPDLKRLREIYERFVDGDPGLESEPLLDVQRELGKYLSILETRAAIPGDKEYHAALDELSQLLAEYREEPSAEHAAALGRQLQLIDSTASAPGVVEALRRHFDHPNLLVRVSSGFLEAGINRTVNDTRDVRETILGTRIRGTGETTGQLRIALLPGVGRWAGKVTIQGVTQSQTVGYNGPARVYSDGTTRFEAGKSLEFNALGISSDDAAATAQTKTRTKAVKTKIDCPIIGPIADRIAWNRSQKTKPKAEVINARRTEQKVGDRMNQEWNERFSTINNFYLDYYRKVLLRFGAFPERISFSNSSQLLQASAVHATEWQLGAQQAPPDVSGDPAIAVRVHESTINNVAVHISGKTFAEDEVKDKISEILGGLPDGWKEASEEEERTITFADAFPVEVTADDGHLTVLLRGKSFVRGERIYPPMNIKATYELERFQGTLWLRRKEALEIIPPDFKVGQDTLSVRQVVVVSGLRRMFDKIFREEFQLKPLKIGGPWKDVGEFPMSQSLAEDGWVLLGWDLPSK